MSQFGPARLVLFFQCPRDLAKERVVNRKQGRQGDNTKVFDKRYKEYLELNPAVLDYYGSTRGKGILVEVSRRCGLRFASSCPMLTVSRSTPAERCRLHTTACGRHLGRGRNGRS